MLNAATRLIDVTTGSVELNGTEITRLKSDRVAKELAVLKQSNHTNLKLTVRELVNFGRFPYSKGRLSKTDKQVVDESLEYMGLTNMQEAYLDELSGGQRQRAFIAMTLAQDTDYIF